MVMIPVGTEENKLFCPISKDFCRPDCAMACELRIPADLQNTVPYADVIWQCNLIRLVDGISSELNNIHKQLKDITDKREDLNNAVSGLRRKDGRVNRLD